MLRGFRSGEANFEGHIQALPRIAYALLAAYRNTFTNRIALFLNSLSVLIYFLIHIYAVIMKIVAVAHLCNSINIK
jgi:hypothetical protein